VDRHDATTKENDSRVYYHHTTWSFENGWGFSEKKWEREVTPEFGEWRKEKIQLQKFGALQLDDPDWIIAMQEELNNFSRNEV
jgi:hypothetical protein